MPGLTAASPPQSISSSAINPCCWSAHGQKVWKDTWLNRWWDMVWIWDSFPVVFVWKRWCLSASEREDLTDGKSMIIQTIITTGWIWELFFCSSFPTLMSAAGSSLRTFFERRKKGWGGTWFGVLGGRRGIWLDVALSSYACKYKERKLLLITLLMNIACKFKTQRWWFRSYQGW